VLDLVRLPLYSSCACVVCVLAVVWMCCCPRACVCVVVPAFMLYAAVYVGVCGYVCVCGVFWYDSVRVLCLFLCVSSVPPLILIAGIYSVAKLD